MLCDFTETARRLRCKCAKTALRIDSQWSRSQIRQSVRAAIVSFINQRVHCKVVHLTILRPVSTGLNSLNILVQNP